MVRMEDTPSALPQGGISRGCWYYAAGETIEFDHNMVVLLLVVKLSQLVVQLQWNYHN